MAACPSVAIWAWATWWNHWIHPRHSLAVSLHQWVSHLSIKPFILPFFFCAIWFSVNHRWLSSMLKNINGQQQIYINKWHFLLIFFWHVNQFRSTWPSIQFIASGTCAYAWWLVCQRYGCIGRFKRSAGRFRLKRFGWRCCATFTVLSPNGKSQNLCVFFQVIKIVLHIRPMFSMLFFFESLFAFRRFAHYTIIHFSTYTLSM